MNLEEALEANKEQSAKIEELTTALTGSNAESAARRKSLKEEKEKNAKFDGIDLDKYHEQQKRLNQVEKDDLEKEGKYKEALEKDRSADKLLIESLQNSNKEKDSALHLHLAQNGIRNEFKGRINNEKQALKILLEDVTVKDNELVIMNGETPRLNEAGTGNITAGEYVDSWLAENPHFEHGTGGGSGSKGNLKGDANKGKTMPRSEFDQLGPVEQTAFMKDGGRPTD